MYLTCSICNKQSEIISQVKMVDKSLIKLSCNHMITIESVKLEQAEKDTKYRLNSLDGKETYQYQIDTAKFIDELAGCRALIAHEMGVGKTNCALSWINAHKNDSLSSLPFIWTCKSSLTIQAQREIYRWTGIITQIIRSSKDYILPGMQGYIISLDLLRSLDFQKQFLDKGIHPNTLVVDECQHIKNNSSERTNSIRRMLNLFKCKNVLGLSGTPIKNHAGEYYPILSILHPEKFGSFDYFIDHYCMYDSSYRGRKITGLRYPEKFRKETESFIIRYTRDEVLPFLPKIDRQFFYVELDEKVKKVYNKEQDKLINLFNDAVIDGTEDSGQMKSAMAEMLNVLKHLVGIAKIEPILDWTIDWLESHESKEKIVLFVHHKDVHLALHNRLKDYCSQADKAEPLSFTSSLNDNERANLLDKFRTSDSQIMICSTLAGGEGLNMQFCSHAAIVERQWNPANEEQAEARFPRPGSIAQSISITYIVAIDSVDDELTQMIEKKRAIFNQAVNGADVDVQKWNESEIIQELTRRLAEKKNKEKNPIKSISIPTQLTGQNV